MSQYAYALDGERMVSGFRAGRGDLDACYLHYGDRACRQTPVVFHPLSMRVAAQDERFDYYEVAFSSPYRRLCYYFELRCGEERLPLLWGFFQKPVLMTVQNIISIPICTGRIWSVLRPGPRMRWFIRFSLTALPREEKVDQRQGKLFYYQGKTVRGKRGGTLLGIAENADYLEEMGI